MSGDASPIADVDTITGQLPSEIAEASPTRRGRTSGRRRTAQRDESTGTSDSVAATVRRSRISGAHTSRTDAYLQSLVASRISHTVWVFVALIPVGVLSVELGQTTLTRAMGLVGLGLVAICLFAIRKTGMRLAEDPDRRSFNLSVLALCLAVQPLIYFYGAYMPFAGLLGLLLLMYNQTAERFWALACTGALAIPHLILNLSLTLGWIPDHGMLTVDGSFGPRLMNLFSVAAIYGLSLLLGAVVSKEDHRNAREARRGRPASGNA